MVEDASISDSDVSLFDLSRYNPVTTEAIPEESDKHASMAYFLDASHYKKITGDLILVKNIRKSYRE